MRAKIGTTMQRQHVCARRWLRRCSDSTFVRDDCHDTAATARVPSRFLTTLQRQHVTGSRGQTFDTIRYHAIQFDTIRYHSIPLLLRHCSDSMFACDDCRDTAATARVRVNSATTLQRQHVCARILLRHCSDSMFAVQRGGCDKCGCKP